MPGLNNTMEVDKQFPNIIRFIKSKNLPLRSLTSYKDIYNYSLVENRKPDGELFS